MPVVARRKSIGRPKVSFRENDPDRYVVALYAAFKYLSGLSAHRASLIIAAFELGNEINPHDISDEGERAAALAVLKRCPPNLAAVVFGPAHRPRKDGNFNNTKVGATSSTLEGRASTYRVKEARARRKAEDLLWLSKLGGCFCSALEPGDSINAAAVRAELIGEAAGEINEWSFAKEHIIPLLSSMSAAFGPPFLLTPILSGFPDAR
jgi:hypothetical protein